MAIKTQFLAQPHVQPVLIRWSRQLALGVTILVGCAVIGAGTVALADVLMHNFILMVLLLMCVFVLGIAVWLPTLLPPPVTK